MQVPFCNDLRRAAVIGAECFFFVFFTYEYTCAQLTTDEINPQMTQTFIHLTPRISQTTLNVSFLCVPCSLLDSLVCFLKGTDCASTIRQAEFYERV